MQEHFFNQYFELDPFLDAAQARSLVQLCESFGSYGMYSEEGLNDGIGEGLPQRFDAAFNFVRTGGRLGLRDTDLGTLVARTNYFRETYAYGDQIFAPGIEPLYQNERLIEAAKQIFDRPIVEPAIVYANILLPGQELAVHVRHQVHHVRVAFDDHQVCNLYRPGFGHTSKIVSPQIDQHQMLGPFFFIRQQFLLQFYVLLYILTPGTGPRNWSDGDISAVGADMDLRRCTDQFYFCEMEVEHVGGGVHDAQRPIQAECIPFVLGVQALGKDSLNDVPLLDVTFTALDRGKKIFLLHVGVEAVLDICLPIMCLSFCKGVSQVR